jgi:hypothetical protein
MNAVTNDILEQLKKIELGMAKTRLNFLLRRTDLNKKTRKLIETYLETLNETEEYFYDKIEKSL